MSDFVLTVTMFLILGTVLLALWVVRNPTQPPSKFELDATTCHQMREGEWTEDEIKDFMDKHGGWYVPPNTQKEGASQ